MLILNMHIFRRALVQVFLMDELMLFVLIKLSVKLYWECIQKKPPKKPMRSELSLRECARFGTSEAIEIISDKVISELRGLREWGYLSTNPLVSISVFDLRNSRIQGDESILVILSSNYS